MDLPLKFRPRGYFAAVVASIALGAAVATTATAAPAAPSVTSSATVTVNATAGEGAVPSTAVGANTAVYDGFMTDPALPALLTSAGVNALRYPGGSVSDVYHWQDNSVVPGQSFANPDNNFDNFMKLSKAAGSQPVITVNYGSGTAAEAAAWVKYANVTNNYGVKYWEVGNEVYGNGAYGSSWEFDTHGTKNATTYAANTGQYIDAMKAADPSIKVGVVLTTPGNWPDGLTAPGDTQDWNHTVLAALGSKIDFVIVHWYPTSSTEAQMLGQPEAQIAGITSTLHGLISQYSGTRPVQIMTTETNSGFEHDSSAAALLAADAYPTWLEQGAANVDWWDIHNGTGSASTDQTGGTDFNDEGVLSNGTCAASGSPCEPAAETPFPPYFGISMAGRFLAGGGTLLGTSSTTPLVASHAVQAAGGSLNVLLINKDPSNSYQVSLAYNGYTPAATGTTQVYGHAATSITSGTSSSSAITLAPYSITMLHLAKSTGTAAGPSAPGNPTASGVTSNAVTLSWPAATAGTNPVTGYRVFRVSGSTSTLVGSPTGTSLQVTGLSPNTAYTFDVVAVDSAGATSAPSAQVVVSTGQPSGATCKVTYTVGTDWGSGFGASIAITNTGTATLTNWSFQYTWPGNQQVSTGWGGDFTQTGSTVTVTAPGYAPTLAAGTTTTPGFNAGYTGTNPKPTAFTLNGQPCTTG
jgi:Cellulose binding domain/Fibronectin type III domain